MSPIAPAPGPLTVYVDGACDLCIGAARFAIRHDRAGRLHVVDLQTAGQTVPARELMQALHVIDDAGTIFRGYDALVAIMVSAPRRRWVAPLLSAPPVRWIGSRVYGFVARRRARRPQHSSTRRT